MNFSDDDEMLAFHHECSSEDDDTGCDVLPRDDWETYWNGELMCMWETVKEQADSVGWSILDTCTFHDWVTFCYEKSSKRKPQE